MMVGWVFTRFQAYCLVILVYLYVLIMKIYLLHDGRALYSDMIRKLYNKLFTLDEIVGDKLSVSHYLQLL